MFFFFCFFPLSFVVTVPALQHGSDGGEERLLNGVYHMHTYSGRALSVHPAVSFLFFALGSQSVCV